MQKLYLAQLTNGKVWNGMCKHYVYEGKNILSFRFIRNNEDILEILAQQKEAVNKIAGDYECCLSTRQFGTEKCDSDFESQWKEESEVCEFDNEVWLHVHIEGILFQIVVDMTEDFSDFCKDS